MKLRLLFSTLLPLPSFAAESISSLLSSPRSYRNASKLECSADEMQCMADGVESYYSAVIANDGALQENDYVDEEFGVTQKIEDSEQLAFMKHWRSYMVDQVLVDPKYASVKTECRNKHELCNFWASIGECDKNPGYMKTNCAPSCKSCEQLNFDLRCPMDENMENAFDEPGDVNRFFERILANEEFAKYNITVHSRPKNTNDDEYVFDGPWLITLENFISPEEAARLIEIGSQQGYERSTDVGELNTDGSYSSKVDSFRTSSNSWCLDDCMADHNAQAVVDRIESFTKIPQTNSESLQLLQYEEGQYYGVHHDLISEQKNRPPGVRILTFYIYLNGNEDSGLEGGGTKFPKVGNGVTVTPKQGRVALWSSVLNDNPHQKDPRTEHTALPVTKGVKYGANAWIHQRDYMTPNRQGCT